MMSVGEIWKKWHQKPQLAGDGGSGVPWKEYLSGRQLLKECEGQVLVGGVDGLSPAVAPAKLCFSLRA